MMLEIKLGGDLSHAKQMHAAESDPFPGIVGVGTGFSMYRQCKLCFIFANVFSIIVFSPE